MPPAQARHLPMGEAAVAAEFWIEQVTSNFATDEIPETAGKNRAVILTITRCASNSNFTSTGRQCRRHQA